MVDTGFYVTDPRKFDRIARPMPNDSDFRVGFESDPRNDDEMGIGGGGMVSTLADIYPVPADAAQWRHPRRQALSESPDASRTWRRITSGRARASGATSTISRATVSASVSVSACVPIPATPSRHRRARSAS